LTDPTATVDRSPAYFGPNFTLASPVPEPSTITLFAVGALGLFGYAWRRRKRMVDLS
jgi:hypothetical protein